MSVRRAFLAALLLGSTSAVSGSWAAEEGSLTGQVSYAAGQASDASRTQLPVSAVVHVSLDDVSLADAPAVTIGEIEFSPVSKQPFFYTLRYDPSRIVPSHRYALQAQIKVAGELLYMTTSMTLATGEVPSTTALVVERVKTAIPTEIVGSWSISQIDGKKTAETAPVFMTFRADGVMSGTGGCNRMMGRAMTAGRKFSFGPIASTEMACPGLQMVQEDAVHKAMQDVVSWQKRADMLLLENAHGGVVLTLIPHDKASGISGRTSKTLSSRNIP